MAPHSTTTRALAPRQDTTASSFDNPSADKLKARWWSGATILNDWLYVDGGDVCNVDMGSEGCSLYTTIRTMNSTLALSLSEPWENSSIKWVATQKPDEVPNMLGARLVPSPDSKSFYQVGGWQSSVTTRQTPSNQKLWKWVVSEDDPSTGAWDTEQLSASSGTPPMRANENAVAWGDKKLFDIGGSVAHLSDPDAGSAWLPQPNMRVYDFEQQAWSEQQTPWGAYAITNAEAKFTSSFGDEGVLVVAGGQLVSQPYGDRVGRQEKVMGYEKIEMYDPKAKKWYSQTATGDIPAKRQAPCSVSAVSPDGTLEIFMYGGLLEGDRNEDLTFSADVYVLTIPGFQWFNVTQASDAQPGRARSHHACVLAADRNMISIGGITNLGNMYDVDVVSNGVAVFDITQLQWTNQYNPNVGQYSAPGVVAEWYSKGNLDNVTWSSDELRNLLIPSKATNDGDDANDDNDDNDANDASHGNVGGSTNATAPSPILASNASGSLGPGARAGIGIGGVIALILLGLLVFFCYRRFHAAAPRRGGDDDEGDLGHGPRPFRRLSSDVPELPGDTIPPLSLKGTPQTAAHAVVVDTPTKPPSELPPDSFTTAEIQRPPLTAVSTELMGDPAPPYTHAPVSGGLRIPPRHPVHQPSSSSPSPYRAASFASREGHVIHDSIREWLGNQPDDCVKDAAAPHSQPVTPFTMPSATWNRSPREYQTPTSLTTTPTKTWETAMFYLDDTPIEQDRKTAADARTVYRAGPVSPWQRDERWDKAW